MSQKFRYRVTGRVSASNQPRRCCFFRMGATRLVLFALLFLIAPSVRGQVRAWEGVLELPAYEEGAPDSNPSFDQFETSRFSYPYTLRKEMTNVRGTHQFRAIYLENEYLKCSVLPDLGGHVYTCVDKISGKPMFYANPSIKKARIGYRGAWAAFGVEFNFPVSHNWVSMSPVDFAFANHKDSSASITVGNIDRVYGMQWTVELTLRPGSTVLEQRVTLSNRSDVRHRFYWWNNAAVQVWDDSQIQYPMRFAGYADLPAKKIWSWGVDADGLDWRNALSDNNSAYVELQAGLFRNQETYAFLEPRQFIAFTEYWMPVRDTGGISRANLAGVVHLERKAGILALAFNANRRLPDGTIQISDGENSLLSEKGDLVPERVWKKEIQIPNAGKKYTFELKNSEGALLLRQTEGEYDWTPESEIKVGPQISYRIPEETHRTENDWLQLGKTEELNGNLLAALRTYQKALVRFPTDFELTKAVGRLDACLQRFEEAVPHLAAAYGRNTSDSEISYYLGIAYEGVGRENDAVDAYEAAMRLPSYRAAAALRLAELQARRGALKEAKDFLTNSLESAPHDLRAGEELAAVSRALGRTTDGEKIAREQLARFPLSNFLQAELGKPNLLHFAADPYRVLSVAYEYARLGLYRRAVEVLSREYPSPDADQSEPGAVVPQKNPLVVYFRGYCREKLGESGANDYSQASRLSTVTVFPNTIEDQRALKAAIRTNEKDATAHYLLGTWYFAREKTEEAIGEWQKARELNPRIPVLEASLGLALLHAKRDFAGARTVFAEAIKNDPSNVVNYSGSVSAMAVLGKPAAERVKALELYPDLDRMPTSLVYELALNRAEEGNYKGATDLFQNRFFGSEEGGTNVRQVWVEVKLQQAIGLARTGHCDEALATAKTLGSPVPGLAFTQDGLKPLLNSARANYLLGETFSACGQKKEADRRYRVSVQAIGPSDVAWAWASARKLNAYDSAQWRVRLNAALSQAESNLGNVGSPGWWLYICGVLEMALGNMEKGKTSLHEALLAPETRMSYHLSRLAIAGTTPRLTPR